MPDRELNTCEKLREISSRIAVESVSAQMGNAKSISKLEQVDKKIDEAYRLFFDS